jgi:hypothetical protein
MLEKRTTNSSPKMKITGPTQSQSPVAALHPRPAAPNLQPATCNLQPRRAAPRRPVHRAILHPLASLLLLAGAGCQRLSYTGPNGERFSRTSLGANTSLQSLAVETGTNGVRRVELHGYTNDSTQAIGTVTEAAVRAALQAVKP